MNPIGQRVNVELLDGSNVCCEMQEHKWHPVSFMEDKHEIILDG